MLQFFGGRTRVAAAAGTIGTVLGLVLILMGVTGGIAGYRLWHVQQTLDRAASAAATSEAQQGCWTAQTSQIVAQVLQGGGLPITGHDAVQVTQYSNAQETTTPYGQMVMATLRWAVPISVVRLQLPTTIPLNSAVARPSQYVALGANTAQSNSACTTPDLTVSDATVATANDAATTTTATTKTSSTCTPTTIEVTKTIPQSESCTPDTKTECSPVTHAVWVNSTHEQCGDTTQYEYTCHPVQHCTPVSSDVCTPIWGEQCGSWSGGTYTSWGYCTTTHSESCTTKTSESCSTTNVCESSPVTTYSCHPVTTGYWQTETTQSCRDVTTTQCQTIAAHTEQVPETVEQCS